MVEQVGKLPEFRDEQINLAELIIKIGEGLADRARQGADAKALAEAEKVVGLHARVAGEPALEFLEPVAAAVEAHRGTGRRAQSAGPRAGARQYGPGHQGRRARAGLRCPRRSGRAVR